MSEGTDSKPHECTILTFFGDGSVVQRGRRSVHEVHLTCDVAVVRAVAGGCLHLHVSVLRCCFGKAKPTCAQYAPSDHKFKEAKGRTKFPLPEHVGAVNPEQLLLFQDGNFRFHLPAQACVIAFSWRTTWHAD
jgi:hypothetical protein